MIDIFHLTQHHVVLANFSTDYQENIADTGGKKPLAETLGKADDTRKYAERLSKFTKSESSDVPGSEEEVPEVILIQIIYFSNK